MLRLKKGSSKGSSKFWRLNKDAGLTKLFPREATCGNAQRNKGIADELRLKAIV